MSEFFTKNNVDIPSIGLGTWDLRGRECENAIQVALDVGYRHIDTAQMYENEKEIGNAITNSNTDACALAHLAGWPPGPNRRVHGHVLGHVCISTHAYSYGVLVMPYW